MADFDDQMANCLSKCLADGMELPFVLVIVTSGGTVAASRYEGPDIEVEMLAKYGDGKMVLPINVMIVDAKG